LDFSAPHFAEPRWLWLALAAPVLLGWLLHRAGRARRRQLGVFAAADVLEALLRSHSPIRRQIKSGLLVLAVAGIGLALARPQWGVQTQVSEALGEDVLFLLDCSRSMLATDVRPNRLTRARLAILDFVQKHGRGRVGLIAFAGQAFLQCPLTFDYDAFAEALLAVDEQTIPVQGTDVARALDEGFLAMEKDSRRKIMVLVTDGEDLEKAGAQRARALAEQGVRIFAVGVGTTAGSPVQIPDGRGGSQPLRDERGQVVESRLDEATLRAIAAATRADYQPLGALGEGLERVRRALVNPTDAKSLSLRRQFGVDRFHFPVAAALVLLVVDSLVGTRRKLDDTERRPG
jgi:Ca-activated chloride channel family protein